MIVATVIEFLAAALREARLEGARGRLDMFADRLVKAAAEPNLASAMEQLLRAMDVPADAVHPPLAARMMTIAGSSDGARVLRWWREQAKLVTLLAATRDQALLAESIAAVTLPEAAPSSVVIPREKFLIGIRVTCESPLAHGADSKAGNATLFRRMQVVVDGGSLWLPFYAGNAVRGQVRDCLADHFLDAVGIGSDRSHPSIALWFFYALYSGGALEENSDAMKALRRQLGDNGAIRAAGIKEFRMNFPALSLLGCALGNRVLAGRCQFADLRPVCREWGNGDRPIEELMSWEYLTRREDHEAHTEHHGMIANTEVLRAGTVLEGGVDHDSAISDLELAALGRGLQLLATRGRLGAENRRGFGRVRFEVENCPDPGPYDDFLASQRNGIMDYMRQIGIIAQQ